MLQYTYFFKIDNNMTNKKILYYITYRDDFTERKMNTSGNVNCT